MHLTGLIFKGVCDNAGHLEIGKHIAFGQGLFTLTYNGITYGDFYIGSKRSKSDYLSVSGQFVVQLTLCIVCLMGRKGSDD